MYGNGKRVVVTGMGAVTPIGLNVPDLWSACLRVENGIGPLTYFDARQFPCRVAGQINNFNPSQHFDVPDARRFDRCTQLGLVAVAEAIQDSGLLNYGLLDNNRVGVLIASGCGGLETVTSEYAKLLEKGPNRVSPFLVPMMIIDILSGLVSMKYGFRGPNFAVVSACASSAHGIGEAWHIIKRGDADVMLAGGSEAAILPISFAGFCKARALSIGFNDRPDLASRPFDKDRDGFVMGEGSGIVVLESLEHALTRGAHIYGEVVGYKATADAHHVTAPHPQGLGAILSMQGALEWANVSPGEVDYINAHGTSTDENDSKESMAISAVFGDYARRIPVSSTKSMTGHLLGAAGSVELIVTILSVLNDIGHPTRYDLNYVQQESQPCSVRIAISNSFGFGGHNVTIAVKAYDGDDIRRG